MAFLNQLVSILTKLLCGGQQNQHQNQNQYPQQNQQQQQQQQYNQQQQGYPPQQQPSWSQVAGGNQGQGHHGKPQQQHKPQQHGGSAQDYYNNQNQNQNQNHQQPQQHQQQQQQWNYQPQHAQYGGYPSKPLPAGGVVGPHHPANSVNATNEQYVNLRNQARKAGDEAHRCFAASQQAYQRGDGGQAHELSQEGKRHQAEQDRLDDQASDWIFQQNNEDSPRGTIDLHGLYVKEAIERTEKAIADGQRQGMDEMRVIVGKGIHSQGHVAKIKPAVQDLMRKYNLSAHIDPHNTGVLVVDLNGRDQGGRSRDAGGLVDDMEKDEPGCVIM